MNKEELEDLIAEAIDDSMGIDWTSRIGARSVIRAILSALQPAPASEPAASAGVVEQIRAVVPKSLLYDCNEDLVEAVASTFRQYVKVAAEAAELRAALRSQSQGMEVTDEIVLVPLSVFDGLTWEDAGEPVKWKDIRQSFKAALAAAGRAG